MPAFLVEGNQPLASDKPQQSLQKINSLAIYPPIPGFAIPAFDQVLLTYFPSTNNVQSAVFKNAGVTVATLTLAYDDSSVNDALITSVSKS